MSMTKEAVIENRGAKKTTDLPPEISDTQNAIAAEKLQEAYELELVRLYTTPQPELTADDRAALMTTAVDFIGRAFDLSRPKIAARDRDSEDADEQVNVVRKYQRWAINSLMRMFDAAIPMVADDLKKQGRRTYSLQHGRSRGMVDEFAINQSLDWEDRHEEVLCILKSLQKAADEGYEVVFDEAYGAVDTTVVVPNAAPVLSDATRARLAARAK